MRVLLVSDVHYTTNLSPDAYRRLHPEAEASMASGDAFGLTQEGKIERLLADVLALGTKPLVDIGGYAYEGREADHVWRFDLFDPKWAWGYEVLETGEGRAVTRHICPAMRYIASNGVFDQPETIRETILFDEKRVQI